MIGPTNTVTGSSGAHATIKAYAAAGSVLTATLNDISIPFVAKDDYYVADIPEYGLWTITCVASGSTKSRILQIDYAIEHEITFLSSYTISGGITDYDFAIGSDPNPDSTLYDGVYASSNQNVNSSYCVAKIDFSGYSNFVVYIRSYAESNYDYILASTLDVPSYPKAYNSGDTKAHTRGNQSSGTTLNSYTKVEYPNDGGAHSIYIVYSKDSSQSSGDDTGRFFIER